MADKVQLIKEEIERRKKVIASINTGVTNKGDQFVYGQLSAYKGLSDFINSLPEEHNKDLEEEATRFVQTNEFCESTESPVLLIARHFAEWQKQKDLEDLFKSDMTMPNKFYEKGKVDAINEMKEVLQTEYEKGRFDMRDEMMKALIGGEIVKDIHNQLSVKSEPLNDAFRDNKFGDKVKIIILKTEQQ